MVRDHHSLLWPQITIFDKSQRGYSWAEITTVYCGHRSQYLISHREDMMVTFASLWINFQNYLREVNLGSYEK